MSLLGEGLQEDEEVGRQEKAGDLVLVKMYAHTRLEGRHRGLLRRYEGPSHPQEGGVPSL